MSEVFAKQRLAVGVVASCIVLMLVSCAAPPPRLGIDIPARIMPLGDSITEGLCDTFTTCSIPEIETPTGGYGLSACNWSLNPVNQKAVGYRAFLRDKLSAAGIKATFVGSVSVVEGLAHEGHSGWTIKDLDYCVQNAQWLEQTKPDVILLHIGTNDMAWAHKPDQMAADLRMLIEHIYAHLPKSTHVIVAQIIKANSGFRTGYVTLPEPANDTLTKYNALIPGVVAEFQTAGNKVSFVDMWGVIQSDADLDAIGVHPNEAASERMADVWLAKIVETLGKRR